MRLFKILYIFLHILTGKVKAFQKCIFYHFLDISFFANIFTIKLDFAKKNSIFANLHIFLRILKVEHYSYPMIYIVIFGHQTWDLERGGGSN